MQQRAARGGLQQGVILMPGFVQLCSLTTLRGKDADGGVLGLQKS